MFPIKKINLSFVSLFIAIFLAFMQLSTTTQASVAGHVLFGNRSDGGACLGCGMCNVTTSTSTAVTPDGVPVSFDLDGSDGSILLMTFKMSDLSSSQPEQAVNMSNASQSSSGYVFDGPYSLNTALFAPLGLLSNPSISKSSYISVTISGDVVTMHIHYDHN